MVNKKFGPTTTKTFKFEVLNINNLWVDTSIPPSPHALNPEKKQAAKLENWTGGRRDIV
jgi:hypothetical protein